VSGETRENIISKIPVTLKEITMKLRYEAVQPEVINDLDKPKYPQGVNNWKRKVRNKRNKK